MTIREAISQVRIPLKEELADSRLTNKAIWSKLLSAGKLLVLRESNALRITYMDELYQSYRCMKVDNLPYDDTCIGIPIRKKFFRSVDRLPDMYIDAKGPIVRNITSLDGTSLINYTDERSVIRSLQDTNSKWDKSVYVFIKEGYLYMTRKVPVEVSAYFTNGLQYNPCCNQNTGCLPFLDQTWLIPQMLIDGVISQVIQSMANSYKKIPDDPTVNKNDEN